MIFFYISVLFRIVFGEDVLFFVEKDKCTKLSDNCPGTVEEPFNDIVMALNFINNDELLNRKEIIIEIKDDKTFLDGGDIGSVLLRRGFALRSADVAKKTEILLGKDNKPFSLNITKGNISFENLIFKGNSARQYIKYSTEDFWIVDAFINIFAKENVNISFINCEFIGISEDLKTQKHLYSSLFLIQGDEFSEVVMSLNLLKVVIKDCHYPKGILNSKAPPPTLNSIGRNFRITGKNLAIINYFNREFLHWRRGIFMGETKEYFDFCFVINNTHLVLDNLSLTNSSRFLLADRQNTIFLTALTLIIDKSLISLAPEQIYLITLNFMQLKGSYVMDSTAFSFDDAVHEGNRDLPILIKGIMSTYAPSNLLDLERDQSLFGFVNNNTVLFSNNTFSNISLYRKDNYMFALINIEQFNEVTLSDSYFEKIIIDSDKNLGVVSMINIIYKNKIFMENIFLKSYSIYGYSNIYGLYFVLENQLTLKNLTFNKTYIKSKSNQDEINTFIENIAKSPEFALKAKTGEIKTGTLLFFFMGNTVFVENVVGNEMYCLFGCLISSNFNNKINITRIHVKKIISESISGSFVLAYQNIFYAMNVIIEEGRGNSGQLYGFKANVFSVESSFFSSNWGIGGYSFRDYIAGSMCFVFDNKVYLKNLTFHTSFSDLFAGAFLLYEGNYLELNDSSLIENESVSSNSYGGCAKLRTSNQLKVRNSSFIQNYGTKGGIFFAESKNTLIITNSDFQNNQGESGTIILMMSKNYFLVKNSTFKKNQGFVEGIFILYSLNQTLEIINCEFKENQAPYQGRMIEISEQNIFIMINVVIEYGVFGIGDFIFLQADNTFIARNFTIHNISNMGKFIYSEEKNNITMEYGNVLDCDLFNSFLFSVFNDSIYITNTNVFNFTIDNDARGFLCALNGSLIFLKNCNFFKIKTSSSMILDCGSSNTIYIHTTTAYNLSVYDSGVCFDIKDNNKILFFRLSIRNFTGFINEVFLIRVRDGNHLELEEMEIKGFYFQEQESLFSSLITLDKGLNNLYINVFMFLSENPKKMNLIFLNLLGRNNTVKIENCRISLKNYISFFYSINRNYLFMKNISIFNCVLLGNFIKAIHYTSVVLSKINFASNILPSNFSMLNITSNSSATFYLITSNTNSLFLYANQSFFNISHSNFMFKNQNKNNLSCPLIIMIEGSVGKVEYTSVFLRENLIESSLIFSNRSDFLSKFSIFSFNKGIKGGVFDFNDQSSLNLSKNKFVGNQGLYGGVLFFNNISKLNIVGNIFYYNKAQRYSFDSQEYGKGGCFYAVWDSEKRSSNMTSIKIEDNYFHSNGAEIGGVIYYQDRNYQEFSVKHNINYKNIILKSKASFYGTVNASSPIDLKILQGSDCNSKLENFIDINTPVRASENLTSCIFTLLAVDYFEQVIIGDVVFKEAVLSYPGFEIRSSFYRNVLCFSFLKVKTHVDLQGLVVSPPRLKFDSKNLSFIQAKFQVPKLFEINFKVRKCDKGDYFELNSLKCLPCEPNFFAFDDEFVEPSSCKSCVHEVFYCYGGFNLTPKTGYWRNSFFSTKFIKCPNKIACLGDLNMFDKDVSKISRENYLLANPSGSCAVMYKGVLCEMCEEEYTKSHSKKCVPCASFLEIILIAVIATGKLTVYFYMIFKAMNLLKNLIVEKNAVILNFLIKIIVGHFQFVRLLLTYSRPSIQK